MYYPPSHSCVSLLWVQKDRHKCQGFGHGHDIWGAEPAILRSKGAHILVLNLDLDLDLFPHYILIGTLVLNSENLKKSKIKIMIKIKNENMGKGKELMFKLLSFLNFCRFLCENN